MDGMLHFARSTPTHSWPNGDSDDRSEVGTNDIRGNDEIWRFFSGTIDSETGPDHVPVLLGFSNCFSVGFFNCLGYSSANWNRVALLSIEARNLRG